MEHRHISGKTNVVLFGRRLGASPGYFLQHLPRDASKIIVIPAATADYPGSVCTCLCDIAYFFSTSNTSKKHILINSTMQTRIIHNRHVPIVAIKF